MLGELGLEENRCTAFVGAGGKTTAVYTCVGGKPPERTSGGGCNDDEDVEA